MKTMSIHRNSILLVVYFIAAGTLVGSAGCGATSPPLSSVPGKPSQKQVLPAKEKLYALIKARVDSQRATGIVLGVRDADGTHTIVAYGEAGPGALPLGPKSVFEVGSISKVFTGILLADMAARGEVGLDDPLQKHAHKGVTIPSRGAQPIRLVDLSTHMSGLPRLPDNFAPGDRSNPYATYTDELLHEFLNGHTLQREVGAKNEYSNLGTGLLGHVLSFAASSTWESLIRERILDPLNMPMSGVSLSPDMKSHLALGHDQEGKVVSLWDSASLSGAGALRSNAEDMLRFVDANLGDAPSDVVSAMRTSHAPRVDAGPSMKIGLNWLTTTKHGRTIVWHNGGTGGYRTFIGFDPERKVGVVVLENSTHGSDDLGFHVLDSRSQLAKPFKSRRETELTSNKLAEYVGVYSFNPQFRLNITLVDGALYSQATNQAILPIYAENASEFFFKSVDAQIAFVRDANRKVTSLVLHQGGKDQVATKLD